MTRRGLKGAGPAGSKVIRLLSEEDIVDQVIEVLQRCDGADAPPMLADDDSHAFDEQAQSASLAVMCVDGEGRPLFITGRARRMCERWNEALEPLGPAAFGLHLPNHAQGLFAAARMAGDPAWPDAPTRMPARWSLHHPGVPELVLTVEAGDRRPDPTVVAGCCLFWFEERALPARLQCLSPSERRVALLVAKGLRNHEIAEQLCRSRRTVEFQLNSIYRKLEVSCRTQLVRVLL